MTDDEERAREPSSLTGEVEPSGHGEWLTYPAAAVLWGIKPKAVYRRITRGRMLGRRNPETGAPEIWVPTSEEQIPEAVPVPDPPTTEEPHSLAVTEAERFALALEASIGRALSPLHDTIDKQQARIEELVRENERLKIAGERRSLLRELWEQVRNRLGYN